MPHPTLRDLGSTGSSLATAPGMRTRFPTNIFYYSDWLLKREKLLLEDSAGEQYLSCVTGRPIVDPQSIEVMNTIEGRTLVTLQTCPPSDYAKRLFAK